MSGLELSLMVEGQEGVTWPQWQELALSAERLGFAGFYRSDHYLSAFSDPDRISLDAWGTICALAPITERIRLGTLVSPVTFRHPSVLAKLVVTASHVSGGRIDLGLGAGWLEEEHVRYGFPFPPLRERLELLAEQAEILRRSWSEETFSFRGLHYQVEGLAAQPKPVAPTRLILGGDGGERSVAIAAAWADEYNTPLPTNDQIRDRRARLLEACDALGRDRTTIGFSITSEVLVGRDRGELGERARRAARLQGQHDVPVARYIAELSDTCVVGTVDEVIERLRTIERLGVRRVVLLAADHTDLEMISLIGTEVVPALTSS
jgi:alkanesulfonate monooxygenase SsuD/methylene tetrahydromethanopterin reductase-like flavin-dependent oxidoreductase (luciferase family)